MVSKSKFIYVYVQAISPGMTRTEFEIRSMKSREEGERIYAEYKVHNSFLLFLTVCQSWVSGNRIPSKNA